MWRAFRTTQPRTSRAGEPGGHSCKGAFTLLELLVVIAIIGILAAIAAPSLKSYRPNAVAAASEQLLADIGRARQLAISQRTTVFMVFVPPAFYMDPDYGAANWTPSDYQAATNLFDKQLIGYNYLTLRSMGDQPGQHVAHYLADWRTLPAGTFIPVQKFWPLGAFDPTRPTAIMTNAPGSTTPILYTNFFGFRTNNIFPFPREQTPSAPNGRWVTLPYIAFNYLGQLVDSQDSAPPPARSTRPLDTGDELLPLSGGSITFQHDASRRPAKGLPHPLESPAGNSTNNNFNVIAISWLTGHPRVLRQEVR